MMNIFDGGFKKKQQPPGPPIYGSCLSDLSMANNKEGGNETKMKRWKGGKEVFLLSDDTYIKQRQRGGNEELRNYDYSIGLWGKQKKISSRWGVGNERLNLFALCVCVSLAGWLLVIVVCRVIIRGCCIQMWSHGRSRVGANRSRRGIRRTLSKRPREGITSCYMKMQQQYQDFQLVGCLLN